MHTQNWKQRQFQSRCWVYQPGCISMCVLVFQQVGIQGMGCEAKVPITESGSRECNERSPTSYKCDGVSQTHARNILWYGTHTSKKRPPSQKARREISKPALMPHGNSCVLTALVLQRARDPSIQVILTDQGAKNALVLFAVQINRSSMELDRGFSGQHTTHGTQPPAHTSLAWPPAESYVRP